MLESQGMQHIHIMSSAVEKVQQVHQHRIDIQMHDSNLKATRDAEHKKFEIQQTSEVEEAKIWEGKREKNSGKGKKNQKRTEEELKMESSDQKREVDIKNIDLDEYTEGQLIDIII